MGSLPDESNEWQEPIKEGMKNLINGGNHVRRALRRNYIKLDLMGSVGGKSGGGCGVVVVVVMVVNVGGGGVCGVVGCDGDG